MRDFDRRHLWHPYGSMREPGPVHEVAAAEGVWLTLADGARMIDAMSSWWAAAHGHRHPRLVAAMQAQLARLPHVMFGGLTHGPAVGLARRIHQDADGTAGQAHRLVGTRRSIPGQMAPCGFLPAGLVEKVARGK